MNLLLVDDEPALLNSLERVFRRKEFKTLKAYDGMQALNILKNNSVDVIISDVQMPELNGLELLKTVSQNYPEIKVILVSGDFDYYSLPSDLFDKIHAYFNKPYDLFEILDSVKKIDVSNYLREELAVI